MPSLVEAARRQLQSRSVYANSVPQLDERAELIDREKVFHSIRKTLGNITGIIAERLRGIARLPTTAVVLQRLRQVPVIESGKWLNVVSEQFIDQAVVEIETFWVWRTGALRKYPRPGD